MDFQAQSGIDTTNQNIVLNSCIHTQKQYLVGQGVILFLQILSKN